MATVEQIIDRLAQEDAVYGLYRPGLGTSRTEMFPNVQPQDAQNGVPRMKFIPNRKVGSAAIAGAVTALIVVTAGKYGIELDAEVAAAVTGLLTVLTGYLVPEKKSD